MFKLLVAYTTHDGHSAKIAERIASTARVADCAVEVCDLARMQPERPLGEYDGVVAGGPLHGGNYVYTDWDAVDKFTCSLSARSERLNQR